MVVFLPSVLHMCVGRHYLNHQRQSNSISLWWIIIFNDRMVFWHESRCHPQILVQGFPADAVIAGNLGLLVTNLDSTAQVGNFCTRRRFQCTSRRLIWSTPMVRRCEVARCSSGNTGAGRAATAPSGP